MSVGHSDQLYTVNGAVGNIAGKVFFIQNLERCIYDDNVKSPANSALSKQKTNKN
jgi:hypothetical protein